MLSPGTMNQQSDQTAKAYHPATEVYLLLSISLVPVILKPQQSKCIQLSMLSRADLQLLDEKHTNNFTEPRHIR